MRLLSTMLSLLPLWSISAPLLNQVHAVSTTGYTTRAGSKGGGTGFTGTKAPYSQASGQNSTGGIVGLTDVTDSVVSKTRHV